MTIRQLHQYLKFEDGWWRQQHKRRVIFEKTWARHEPRVYDIVVSHPTFQSYQLPSNQPQLIDSSKTTLSRAGKIYHRHSGKPKIYIIMQSLMFCAVQSYHLVYIRLIFGKPWHILKQNIYAVMRSIGMHRFQIISKCIFQTLSLSFIFIVPVIVNL